LNERARRAASSLFVHASLTHIRVGKAGEEDQREGERAATTSLARANEREILRLRLT